jgi:hypothetical protein
VKFLYRRESSLDRLNAAKRIGKRYFLSRASRSEVRLTFFVALNVECLDATPSRLPPLHSHSSELKNVIISGVWYTGADAASAKDFGLGSIVVMPGNWVHVSGCRSGSDCVFYQEGKGKFDFKPAGR